MLGLFRARANNQFSARYSQYQPNRGLICPTAERDRAKMSPQVKLTYFPVQGRAEIIRLILNAGAIEYTEETIQQRDWPEKKPSKAH